MPVNRKKTSTTGLLTNFLTFISYSYKINLIHTLVGTAYKIKTVNATFNDDFTRFFNIFKNNKYPESSISRVVKSYAQSSKKSASPADTSTSTFKLQFLTFSNFTQSKARMLAKKYCKNWNIKLIYSSFKIKGQLRIVCTDHLAVAWYTNLRLRDVIQFTLEK